MVPDMREGKKLRGNEGRMKRGGMYDRGSRSMPGCITALVALSVAAYAVSLVAIGRAVAGLLK